VKSDFEIKWRLTPYIPQLNKNDLQNIYKRYIQVNNQQFTIGIKNRSQSGLGRVDKEYHRMEPKKTLYPN